MLLTKIQLIDCRSDKITKKEIIFHEKLFKIYIESVKILFENPIGRIFFC